MGPEKDIANRRMSADHEIMKQQYICFKNSHLIQLSEWVMIEKLSSVQVLENLGFDF